MLEGKSLGQSPTYVDNISESPSKLLFFYLVHVIVYLRTQQFKDILTP